MSVNERLAPHLATRAEAYAFPAGVERSAWVLELEADGLGFAPLPRVSA